MTLLEIIERFHTAHVVVVGDAMTDRYVWGRVERICPEAPVPILAIDRVEDRPGGAANVAAQLKALGCLTFEVFGKKRCFKHRFMAGSHILLRADEDVICTPTPDEIERVYAFVRQACAGASAAVVISDYGRGWVTSDLTAAVIEATKVPAPSSPVLVDPCRGRSWAEYGDFDLICPNEEEYAAVLADNYGCSRSDKRILHKMGARGMELTEPGKLPPIHIPATARHVYDVTGAGDTVIAVVAAAVAVGATYYEAATLAAAAAGYVVGEVGTVACPLEKLKELING